MSVVLYSLVSVIVVSLVSFMGILPLLMRGRKKIDKSLLLLISVSAGALFGEVFIHILPEIIAKEGGFSITFSLIILGGIIAFFLLEKFIHWHHCQIQLAMPKMKAPAGHYPTHLAPLSLLGDAFHNFIDGLIIAGSYLIAIPLGIATTIAVIFHEIPQEIGDFGILLYAGLTKKKALLLNFASATMAIFGAIVGLIIGMKFEAFVQIILPFTAGGFLYIAGSNLVPELHKECGAKESAFHFLALISGVGIMLLLKFLG